MEPVHGVGRAVGKSGVVFEGPAVLLEARNGMGDGDGALELLERAED
jgi:hypothetical protein